MQDQCCKIKNKIPGARSVLSLVTHPNRAPTIFTQYKEIYKINAKKDIKKVLDLSKLTPFGIRDRTVFFEIKFKKLLYKKIFWKISNRKLRIKFLNLEKYFV